MALFSTRILIFSGAIIIGIFFSWFYGKYGEREKDGYDYSFNKIVVMVLVAGLFACPVDVVNESKFETVEFVKYEITDKAVFEGRFEDTYGIEFDTTKKGLPFSALRVSESYYNEVLIGEEITICICTGLLGMKLYLFYEDLETAKDHPLNQWAYDEAVKRNIVE